MRLGNYLRRIENGALIEPFNSQGPLWGRSKEVGSAGIGLLFTVGFSGASLIGKLDRQSSWVTAENLKLYWDTLVSESRRTGSCRVAPSIGLYRVWRPQEKLEWPGYRDLCASV